MRIANEIQPVAGREKNAAARGLFTPCAGGISLLKTSPAAAKFTARNDSADLLSPACSSFGQYRQQADLAELHSSVENFNGAEFFEEKFPALNQQDQPTTNTSKKGREQR